MYRMNGPELEDAEKNKYRDEKPVALDNFSCRVGFSDIKRAMPDRR